MMIGSKQVLKFVHPAMFVLTLEEDSRRVGA